MAEISINLFECAACGAPLDMANANNGICRCRYCAYTNILAKENQTDEVLQYLHMGDNEINNSAFERAYNAYRKAADLDPEESKAFFGMALATNRIKYVKDVVNNRWQAICYEITTKKFGEDKNYKTAVSLATDEQKAEYETRAYEIDYIRAQFSSLEEQGIKYDTFICVKVSEEGGGYTQDSMLAMKLYDTIKASGARPFYSEKDIGERMGEDYEALILYALYCAKSFILVCSNEDYLRTPWVQNEYSRYYAMMADKEKVKNSIIIAFDGNVVERIPGIPGKIQGVNLRSFDASQKINEFVRRFITPEEPKAPKKAAVKYCIKCGSENPTTAKFCSECAGDAFALNAAELVKAVAASAPKARAQRPEPDMNDYDIAEGRIVEYKGNGGDVVIPDGVKSTAWGFKKCSVKSKITSISFPETLTTISTEEFSGCTQLTELDFPDSIEFIGEKAFANCTNLEKISIPAGPVDIDDNAFIGTKFFEDRHNWRNKSFYVGNCLCKTGSDIGLKYYIPEGTVCIGSGAFADSKGVERVHVPEGVTHIYGWVFNECKKLTGISLPESLKHIGGDAFRNCTALTDISIPGAVTSIGRDAFEGCTGLKFVTMPRGFDVREIFGAECSHIEFEYFDGELSKQVEVIDAPVTNESDYVIINGLLKEYTGNDESIAVPTGVTKIGDNAFAEKNVKKVVLPDTVKRIGASAFKSCRELREITIPDSVTYIDEEAFYWCNKMEELVIPDSVTHIGNTAFVSCRGMKKLRLPANLTTITEDLCKYCVNLVDVNIPESVTVIEDGAFYECSLLTEVVLPANLESLGKSVFMRCDSNTRFVISDSNQNYTTVDGVLFSKDMTRLIHYPCSKADTFYEIPYGVTEICGNAFTAANKLEGVDIPGSVKTIAWGAFCNAKTLKRLEIPSSVTTIEKYAFDGCESITEMILPTSLKYDSAVFDGEEKHINLIRRDVLGRRSAGATSSYTAPAQTSSSASSSSSSSTSYSSAASTSSTSSGASTSGFNIRDGLLLSYKGNDKKVVIPDGVTEIDSCAFDGCNEMESVFIPDSVVKIGNFAFDGCQSLAEVRNSEQLEFIGDKAFYDCPKLRYFYFPNTLTHVGDYAFAGCTSLGEANFRYGVKEIGLRAFQGCTYLLKVVIPGSVTRMENYAFSGCRNATIYCELKKPFFGLPSGWDKLWLGADKPKPEVVWNA